MHKKTILVLDDEELMVAAIFESLGSAGYRAFGMESKRLALHWIKEHHPDLVITDINAPEMNGFEFIDALKADPELAQTRFIVVSGNVDLTKAIRLSKLGAADVFVKPFEMEELLSRIEETLSD